MAERQAERQRLGLERVGAAAGRVGRRENMNDFFAARMEQLQGALGKRRLPDKRDALCLMNLHRYVQHVSGTGPTYQIDHRLSFTGTPPTRVRPRRLWVDRAGPL